MCRSILIQPRSSLVLMLVLEHLNPCRHDFDYDYQREHEHEHEEYTRHLPVVAVCGKFPSRRSGGGTGRHVRLRGVCRKACGFKSRPEHHSKLRPLTDFHDGFMTLAQN